MFDINFSKDHIQYHLQVRESSESDANLHIGSKHYSFSLEGASRLAEITDRVKAALESSHSPINAESLCAKLTQVGMSDVVDRIKTVASASLTRARLPSMEEVLPICEGFVKQERMDLLIAFIQPILQLPRYSPELANFARSLQKRGLTTFAEGIFQEIISHSRVSSPSPSNDDPHFMIPPLTGSFSVGVKSFLVYREDKGEQRQLLIDVHYPGQAKDSPQYQILDLSWPHKDPHMQKKADNLWARSQPGLSIAEGKFPIVLFSHGGGTNLNHYQQIVEELTSQGYCVVTVNHPSSCNAAHYFGQDPLLRSVPELCEAGKLPEEITTKAEDLRFVATQLQEGKIEGLPALLGDHGDISSIGFIGHSMGGAAAVLAAEGMPSCKGAINIDGRYWGVQRPIDTPTMLLVAGEDISAEWGPKAMADWAEFDRLNPEKSQRIVIPDAIHEDFTTDPHLLLTVGVGTVDRDKLSTITSLTNQAVLEFFDEHLRPTRMP